MSEDKVNYYNLSKSAYYSIIFIIPLFILYEVLAFISTNPYGGELRNAAEVWIMQILSIFGAEGLISFSIIALVVICGLLIYIKKTNPVISQSKVNTSYFWLMLLESVLYSFLLGFVVIKILKVFFISSAVGILNSASSLSSLSLSTQLMLCLGAGVFEELLFRVILYGGMLFILKKLFSKKLLPIFIAAIVSSLIFSYVHYIGTLGDTFELYSFAYRALSGLIFVALYEARGFGIAAYTHALYDVWVTLGVI